jgi:hypothetical protein
MQFRQASVLLLKVSINVRTILKFITFEFILIAHHYETFIYSLIELHCFTFSSCKRRGKAKVIYDTINKGKEYLR